MTTQSRPAPRRRMLVFLLAWLALPAVAAASPAETYWQALLFDGIKVGHAMGERRVVDGRVITRETMVIEIRRAGEPVRLDSEVVYEETPDGKPLAFANQTRASAQETTVQGTIADGRVAVRQSGAGISRSRELAFPADLLLGEGQRLKLVQSGLQAGATVRFRMFETSMLEPVEVITRVLGPRQVEVYDRDLELIEVEQTVQFPDQPIVVRAFVDRQFKPYRSSMQMLGMRIETVTCDRACALKENQPLDYLNRLLVEAPRPLQARELARGLLYRLRTRDGQPLRLPDTPEQRVSGNGSAALELRVCSGCGPAGRDPAAALGAATRPTLWLQSDEPELQAMALRAVGKADSPTARMAALTRFVRGHIRTKDLSVGYASALETARNRSGDCTEHALLLAALGRALGIPSRIATGFAYVDAYGDGRHVFVPHAWTQAYVDGGWRSYDAALAGFDAGHIVIATGDGDPSRFYAGMNVLGNLEVQSVQALPRSGR